MRRTQAFVNPLLLTNFHSGLVCLDSWNTPRIVRTTCTKLYCTSSNSNSNSNNRDNTKMGWQDTWDDILQGGSQRWKVNDSSSHQTVLSILQQYMKTENDNDNNNNNDTNEVQCHNDILCPLAGDDPMVHLLWKQGHSVTAIDLVPVALERMRTQFDGDWIKEEENNDGSENGMVVWKHESGRATQYQGDALQSIPELQNKFDMVYDKDSFGALPIDMRHDFCSRIAEYTKQNALIYIEVKLRDDHNEMKDVGPPFSLKKEDLMQQQYYGNMFDHVKDLGSVYPARMAGTLQTGHILKRK